MIMPFHAREVAPPLEVDNANNHGGMLAITAASALSFVLVALPIRIYVRNNTYILIGENICFFAAAILSILQSTALFYALGKGYGASTDQIPKVDFVTMEKAVYISNILYIVTLCASKCSTASLYMRIGPDKDHHRASMGVLLAAVVFAIISVFIIGVTCNSSQPWTDVTTEMCSSLLLRWQIVTAMDIFTELLLFAISIYLVCNLQMSIRSKIIVVAAFSFRLPTIAAAGLRVHYLSLQFATPNWPLPASTTSAATQFEIGYGILASIVPCLKPFMAAYEGPALGPSRGASTNNRDKLYAHKLSDISSTQNSTDIRSRLSTARGFRESSLRPEKLKYQVNARRASDTEGEGEGQGEMGDELSIGSDNSRRMIINKAVEWTIVSERGEVRDSTGSTEVKVTHS